MSRQADVLMSVDFLHEAIRLARENVEHGLGGPFGAIVVRNNEIIARAQNRVTQNNDPTAHAEICAIRAACQNLNTFRLSGCVLYSSCEPCPMCLAACYWARLDAVYFGATQTDAARAGFDDAHLYREVALPLNDRALKTVFVPEAENAARAVFTLWDAMAAKTPY